MIATREEAVARARSLAAGLVGRRRETEALQRIPDATIEEFVASDLLRINQSARFGGPELGIEAIVDVVAEVAKGDAASGWVFGILASHFWMLSLFPEAAQEELWGTDPRTLASSANFASEGSCEQVEGGFRVSGRWPFSSGADHGAWAMVGVTIPPADPAGAPTPRWCLVPRSDYTVAHDWDTVALEGTGSNSVVIADAFVPAHRTIDPMEAMEGRAPGGLVHPSPLFRLPLAAGITYYLVAPALGAASRVYDDWVAHLRTKRNVLTGEAVAEQTPTHVRIGKTSARLDAAWTVARSVTREMDASMAAGVPLDAGLSARAMRDAAFSVRQSVKVVDTCMRFSGASGLFRSNPVQQGWRDVHGVAAHVGFNTDSQYGAFGRAVIETPAT